MKIEGIVTAVFRDVNTGEITKQITNTNHVTQWWLGEMTAGAITNSSTNNSRMFGTKIFISSFNVDNTDPDIYTIGDVKGLGYIESGITSPRRHNGTETEYGYTEHQQRFNPPASDITIRVIGMTAYTSTSDGRVQAQCWVRLTEDCIQTTSETLDVFYRIQFPYGFYNILPDPNTTLINDTGTDIILTRYTTDAGYAVASSGYMFGSHGNSWHGRNCYVGKLNRFTADQYPDKEYRTDAGHHTYSRTVDTTLKYATLKFDLQLNEATGRLMGSVSYGYEGRYQYWNRYMTELGTSPLQNPFGHSASATKPFYDSLNANTGDGTMTFNGDAWTNPDYPQILRLNITTGGGVGVGEYQLWVRNHFGFWGNFYREQFRLLPAWNTHNSTNFTEEFKVASWDLTSDETKYSRPSFVVINKNEIIAVLEDDICVLNVSSAEGKRFHVSLYPSFNPTSISQVEVDPTTKTIWVACRTSGLYKITDPLGTPTITLYDNVASGSPQAPNCYGVKYGNGRLWAAFEGDLYYTTNEGTIWTPAAVSLTADLISWNEIVSLQPNPSSADHQIAIVYRKFSGSDSHIKITWWDQTNDSSQGPTATMYRTTGYYQTYDWTEGNTPYRYMNVVAASKTQGHFGTAERRTSVGGTYGYCTYFEYGTTNIQASTVGTFSTPGYTFFATDEQGNESMMVFDANHRWYRADGTHSSANLYADDTEYGYHTGLRYGFVAYLGDGIVICFRSPSSYNGQQYHIVTLGGKDDPDGGHMGQLLWKKYGWNGAAWELNHADSKPIHASAEELIDGTTVAFDDDGGTQTFVASDYYTIGVVDGVWMDGATITDHYTRFYLKPIKENQTDIEFSTLPNTMTGADMTTTQSSFTWNDSVNLSPTAGDFALMTGTPAGGRSVPTITPGSGSGAHAADTGGYVTWRMNNYDKFDETTGNSSKITFGFSPISVIGSSNSHDSCHFAMVLDGNTHPLSPLATLYVVEQGVTKFTYGTVTMDSTNYYRYTFKVRIRTDKVVEYWLYNYSTDWVLIYTGSVPANDTTYLIDTYMSGSYTSTQTGAGAIRLASTISDDYYISLGDPNNQTGRWEPEFYIVDPTTHLTVTIDGTVATPTASYDDYTTVLSAGQFSCFRNGQLRYSPDDVNKSISVNYIVEIDA
jgi:hypothetical protein